MLFGIIFYYCFFLLWIVISVWHSQVSFYKVRQNNREFVTLFLGWLQWLQYLMAVILAPIVWHLHWKAVRLSSRHIPKEHTHFSQSQVYINGDISYATVKHIIFPRCLCYLIAHETLYIIYDCSESTRATLYKAVSVRVAASEYGWGCVLNVHSAESNAMQMDNINTQMHILISFCLKHWFMPFIPYPKCDSPVDLLCRAEVTRRSYLNLCKWKPL